MADETRKEIIVSVSTDASGASAGIDEVKGKLNELNNVDTSKSVKSFKTEIKEAVLQAKKMEEQFGKNSVQFAEAGKKVANLKDRFGEFNKSVEAFNPDNKLQALTSLGAGAVGAVQGVAGAMTLLGDNSEDTGKIVARLQALMALSGALNSIDDIKNSFKNFGAVVQDSTLVVKGNQAATAIASGTMKLFGVAAEETSVGFKILKGAIAATGIGLLVVGIGYAIENLDKLKQALGFASAEQEAFNKTYDDYKKAATSAIQKVNEVKTAFDLAKEGVISKKAALQKYNDTLGDSFGKTNDLVKAEKLLTDKADDFIKITGLKAQANALFTLSAEQSSKALLASQEDQTGFLDKAKAGVLQYFGNYGASVAVTIKAQQDGVKEAAETANKSADILKTKGEELLSQAAEIGKNSKIKVDVIDNKDNSAEEKKAEEERKAKAAKLAEQLKAEREKLKQHQEEIKKITDDALRESGESALNERDKELAVIDDKFNSEDATLQKNYDEQLEILKAELKRKAITQQQYNQQALALDISASDAVVAIAEEKGAKKLEVEQKYNKIISEFINGYQETEFQKSREKLIADFDEKIKVADDKQKELLEKLKTKEVDKLDKNETLRKDTVNTETTFINTEVSNAPSDDDTPEARVTKLQAVYDAEKAFKDAKFQEELAKLGEDKEAIENLTAEHNKNMLDDEQENSDKKKAVWQAEKEARVATLQSIGSAAEQLGNIIGQQTVAGKALAIAGALINTYLGVTKALSQGGIIGIATGAVVLAAGIASVAKIVSTKVPVKGGGGSAAVAPTISTAPIINAAATSAATNAVSDVRVVNPQSQVVKAYVTDRDLKDNEQKSSFLNRLSTI